MTAKSSRRVVIINNIKSDKIEQAIFILRGSNLQKPDRSIIKEAQNIIDDYVRRIGGEKTLPPPLEFSSSKGKRKRFGAGLVTIMISALLLCLVFVVRQLSM